MEREQSFLEQLAEQFPGIDKDGAVLSLRRIYVSVPRESFMDILTYAHGELGFDLLCAITGRDTGEGYEFIYHIAEPKGTVLNLKYKTEGGDGVVIPSVLPIFHGATFYERELEGLLGVKVDGLPEGRPYPLPDNWPEGEYPMRKDWKPKAKQDVNKEGEANG